MKENLRNSKLYKFFIKYNVFYLILPIIIYLIMWLCYNLAIVINKNEVILNFKIDQYIPYIKYFVIFYLTYYFMPIVLLWAISFKSKNKYYQFLSTLVINNFICYVFYCFLSVKVIRESSVDMNMSIFDIKSFDGIFDYLVSFIYRIDKEALNSLPSIHAGTGLLMVLMCISFNKTRLNKWLIFFGIISGVGCILATVFIKQHNLIDVIIGLLLTTIVYFIVILVNKLKKTSSINGSLN